MGALCGYVGLPRRHPAHGKDFADLDIAVHGGLTYSAACDHPRGICHTPAPGDPDDLWWLGFDCGHAFDLSPGLRAVIDIHVSPKVRSRLAAARSAFMGKWEVYRDLVYVRAEVEKLARQCLLIAERARLQGGPMRQPS